MQPLPAPLLSRWLFGGGTPPTPAELTPPPVDAVPPPVLPQLPAAPAPAPEPAPPVSVAPPQPMLTQLDGPDLSGTAPAIFAPPPPIPNGGMVTVREARSPFALNQTMQESLAGLDPTRWDRITAAFHDTMLGRVIASGAWRMVETDPNFDAAAVARADPSIREQDRWYLGTARNRDEYDRMHAYIGQRRWTQRVSEESPLLHGLLSTVMDPTNLIPIGAAWSAATRTAIGNFAARSVTGAATLGGLASANAIFDPTYDLENINAAIRGGAVFGALTGFSGLSGTSAGLAVGRYIDGAESGAARLLRGEEPAWTGVTRAGPADLWRAPADDGPRFGPSTVGAAGTLNIAVEGEFGAVGRRPWMDIFVGTPVWRVANSVSDVAAETMHRLSEIPWLSRRNVAGLANPGNVQSDQFAVMAVLNDGLRGYERAFQAQRYAPQDAGSMLRRGLAELTGRGRGMDRAAFEEAVHDTVLTGQRHADQAVNDAARIVRDVLDRIGLKAEEAGLMGQGVVGVARAFDTNVGRIEEWYVPRIFDRAAIAQNAEAFERDLVRMMSERGGPRYGGRSTSDLRRMARTIRERIAGERPFRGIDDEHLGIADAAKLREIDLPSTWLARWTVRRPSDLMRYYARTMGVDASLARRFGDVSMRGAISEVMQDWFTKIADDMHGDPKIGHDAFVRLQSRLGVARGEASRAYKQLYDRGPPTDHDAFAAEVAKIREKFIEARDDAMDRAASELFPSGSLTRTHLRERDMSAQEREAWQMMHRDLDDIRATRDLLRGTFGQLPDALEGWGRALATARRIAVMSTLTGVTSQINDIGALVMKEGFQRTMGAAFATLRHGLSVVRLAKREAELAGTAWEMVNADRVLAMNDLGADFAGRHTMFERAVNKVSDVSFVLNGNTPWTDAAKGFASLVVGTRILEDVYGAVAGRQGNIARLARAGITPGDAQLIEAQAHHWTQHGEVIVPNTARWTNPDAVAAFRRALAEDVDNVVVGGDGPHRSLFLSKPLGQTVGMFIGYGQAVAQRVLIPTMQEADARSLGAVGLMIGLGAMTDAMRRQAIGDHRDISTDQLLTRAIDRSGVTAHVGNLWNRASTLFDTRFGLNFLGSGQPGRHAGEDQVRAAGAIGGPAADRMARLGRAVLERAVGDNQGMARDVRALLPLQNVSQFHFLFSALEQGLSSGLDLITAPSAGGESGHRRPAH